MREKEKIMITKITIDASKVKTRERYEKIRNISEEIHTVINSKYFMDQVMKIRKHGERSKYKDSTNTEIYKMLKEGAEGHSPEVDNEWDIFISTFRSMGSAIGKTISGDKTIYVKDGFFDRAHPVKVGSLIVHEQGHHLGFSHDFWSTPERPFSICYQLNLCYEAAYSRIFNVYPVKRTVCKRSWKYLWLKRVCYVEEVWPEY